MSWFNRFGRSLPEKAAVLMYHRIADVALDPWELAVSPDHFEEQLQVLQKKYNIISIESLVASLCKNKVPRGSVCITFDDGYADNYTFAKPLLETYKLPATFFIPTYYTGLKKRFWWDELTTLILETSQLPQLFQLSIPGLFLDFDLGADASITPEQIEKQKYWTWTEPAPTLRCALYLKIWMALKPLPYPQIESTMTALRNVLNTRTLIDENAVPMHHAQLQDLCKNPLFHLGLHTATHPALAHHAKEVQHQEIAENRNALQSYGPVNAIAFPYGSFNNDTLSVLAEAGIAAGFSTAAHTITPGANRFCLGRFQVKNEDGAAFEKQLDQWMKL